MSDTLEHVTQPSRCRVRRKNQTCALTYMNNWASTLSEFTCPHRCKLRRLFGYGEVVLLQGTDTQRMKNRDRCTKDIQ